MPGQSNARVSLDIETNDNTNATLEGTRVNIIKMKSGNNNDWSYWYAQLQAFFKETGHCNVTYRDPNWLKLDQWVYAQRSEAKKCYAGKQSSVTKDRIQKLEAIGFFFEAQHNNHSDTIWNAMHQQLQQFQQENGHTNVPRRDSQNKALGHWVSQQRVQYKKLQKGEQSGMNQDRISKLEAIGFCFDLLEHEWNTMYQYLQQFEKENGHTKVPTKYTCNNKKLGLWVKSQRAQYKKFKAGEKIGKRMEKLEIIGFSFELQQHVDWNTMYKQLQQFKKENGHTNVSQRYTSNKKLGIWVKNQRNQYAKFKAGEKSTMTQDRILKLQDIDFLGWNAKRINDEKGLMSSTKPADDDSINPRSEDIKKDSSLESAVVTRVEVVEDNTSALLEKQKKRKRDEEYEGDIDLSGSSLQYEDPDDNFGQDDESQSSNCGAYHDNFIVIV